MWEYYRNGFAGRYNIFRCEMWDKFFFGEMWTRTVPGCLTRSCTKASVPLRMLQLITDPKLPRFILQFWLIFGKSGELSKLSINFFVRNPRENMVGSTRMQFGEQMRSCVGEHISLVVKSTINCGGLRDHRLTELKMSFPYIYLWRFERCLETGAFGITVADLLNQGRIVRSR